MATQSDVFGYGTFTQVDITGQGDLRLQDATGGEYAGLEAPATLSASYILTMPPDYGTVDQVLTTDGAGVLGWASVNPAGGIGVFSQVDITGQGDLRLQDATGGEYVALEAPATLAASYTLIMPVDDGDADQLLSTDGAGALSWATAGGAYNGWLVKSAAYDALPGDQIVANSAGAFTITLPITPSIGDTVVISNTDAGGVVAIDRNGSNIQSTAADGSLAAEQATQLVYTDPTIGWFQI